MKITVKQALSAAADQLQAIEDADHFIEAGILLAHTLGKPRAWLFTWPEHVLPQQDLARLNTRIERRLSGEPISYITGIREFYGIELKVSTHTLIPRHETELLVEIALDMIKPSRAEILELGTGSGAITAALATQRPGWQHLATDIDPRTLETARFNFSHLAVNVQTCQSNWFDDLPSGAFDLIISNPPYIEAGDPHLNKGDLRFEPLQALASGPDGLDAIRQITRECPNYLKPGGFLMLEHGYHQKTSVQDLCRQAGLVNIQTFKDLQGNDRVTSARAT